MLQLLKESMAKAPAMALVLTRALDDSAVMAEQPAASTQITYAGPNWTKRLVRVAWLIGCLVLIAYSVFGPWWLVVDRPEKSDLILVLDGETNVRPARAVALLKAGYGNQLLFNVSERFVMYSTSERAMAEQYIRSLPPDLSARSAVCAIDAFSTREEAHAADVCLQRANVHSILIVTSDFHSRRALMIFRHEMPQYHFSVASAMDRSRFGRDWWSHREWAKTFYEETSKVFWFELIERWLT